MLHSRIASRSSPFKKIRLKRGCVGVDAGSWNDAASGAAYLILAQKAGRLISMNGNCEINYRTERYVWRKWWSQGRERTPRHAPRSAGPVRLNGGARALKQSRKREREKTSGSRLSGRCGDAGCPLLLGYPQPTGKLFAGTCESERAYIYIILYLRTNVYARRINLQAVCQNKRRVKLKLALRALKENISVKSLLIIYQRCKENFRSFHTEFSLSGSFWWKFSFQKCWKFG